MNHSHTTSDIDFFADDVILDPYDTYRVLRDAGPAVWLDRHDVVAVTRYEDVRRVLADWETFSSASGVAMNDYTNSTLVGTTIASDPPRHTTLRNVVGDRLTPRSLRPMRGQVAEVAEELVERVVSQGAFETVTELAQQMPLTVVPDMLGFPGDIRDRMVGWAAAGFDTMGPSNARTGAQAAVRADFVDYAVNVARCPRDVAPGTLVGGILAAGADGRVDPESCPALLLDYLVPSVDTTISAIGNAVWLFSRFPAQWHAVCADPSLIPNALNEVIRFESPARCFTRLTTTDTEIDGVGVAAGTRVMVVYASANRDERFWDAPDTFDVTRENAPAHLGFGYGVHSCAGQGLARLEAQAVLAALASRVTRFEAAGPAVHVVNSLVRALSSFPVTVVPNPSGTLVGGA